MIVCKYGILMTLLWLKKNRVVTYQIQILSHKSVCQKYDKFMQLKCKRFAKQREKRSSYRMGQVNEM